MASRDYTAGTTLLESLALRPWYYETRPGFPAANLFDGSDASFFYWEKQEPQDQDPPVFGDDPGWLGARFTDDGAIPAESVIDSVTVHYRHEHGGNPAFAFTFQHLPGAGTATGLQLGLPRPFADATRQWVVDAVGAPFTAETIFDTVFGWMTSWSSTGAGGTHHVSQAFLRVAFTLPVPTVRTDAATDIDATVATLNGMVNPNSATVDFPVSYHFEYGTTVGLGTSTPTVTGIVGADDLLVFEAITGLTDATEYFYRLVATTPEATVNGDIRSFTTGGSPPPPPPEEVCKETEDPPFPL